MAKNSLLLFIKDKVGHTGSKKQSGPVITISREYGCPGIGLSQDLADALSKKRSADGRVAEWKALDKEIISRAAHEVDLTPGLVEKLYKEKSMGFFADLFKSFSDHYVPSDVQVKKTVAGVVRAMAHEGHVVILGRGGVVLTHDMPRSLHVKLFAPLDWRIERVKVMDKVKEPKARQLIETVDRERIYLRNFLAGEQTQDSIFDLHLNAARLTVPEMVAMIVRVLEVRKIVV
ncbi:MAG: cytidylate kinase-like family protein [Spirochaetia bacterium]|nr:cytidylate kinase-like family protein [Spirochaetia bacterium]